MSTFPSKNKPHNNQLWHGTLCFESLWILKCFYFIFFISIKSQSVSMFKESFKEKMKGFNIQPRARSVRAANKLDQKPSIKLCFDTAVLIYLNPIYAACLTLSQNDWSECVKRGEVSGHQSKLTELKMEEESCLLSVFNYLIRGSEQDCACWQWKWKPDFSLKLAVKPAKFTWINPKLLVGFHSLYF